MYKYFFDFIKKNSSQVEKLFIAGKGIFILG